MKKLFTTMLAAVTALAALASTDYPGTVHVDGFNLPAAVTVSQSGDNYTVTFGSFSQLGTVEITAPGTTTNGVTTIVTSQQIDGGLANAVIAFNQYALGAHIDILTPQGTTKTVTFTQDGEATGYQIKNSGFENFKSNGEPFAWHGFKSATGGLASMAPGSLTSSTDSHSGSKSAVMTSGSLFGVVGNGTMTTGRLNAGSAFATDPTVWPAMPTAWAASPAAVAAGWGLCLLAATIPFPTTITVGRSSSPSVSRPTPSRPVSSCLSPLTQTKPLPPHATMLM